MTQGRDRDNTTRAKKFSNRGRGSTSLVNISIVPIPITSSQQGSISSLVDQIISFKFRHYFLLVRLLFKHQIMVVRHHIIFNKTL
uniref:Uncharacterized protein n=1 Tax=Solanum lycopersicum TaxID=4081 RepID=A0A3Q7IGL6_SOLLC